MGAYLCIASNSIPPSVSKRIMVNVHCKYSNTSIRIIIILVYTNTSTMYYKSFYLLFTYY